MLYQPKIHDHFIRKLYFRAKREGKPMTTVLNDIMAHALINEPEPPAYEKRKHRQDGTHQNKLDRPKEL